MGIGMNGGNDQGASLETQFDEASKIGCLVVETAKRRDEVRISENQDTPNIPFLEPSKLSPKYICLLTRGEKIDEGSIKDAEGASIALSLEASLQIVNAKSVKPTGIFVESVESLEDIELLLEKSRKFIKSAGDRVPNILSQVAMQIIQENDVQNVPADLVEWSNEISEKAYLRIDKKIEAVRSVLG